MLFTEEVNNIEELVNKIEELDTELSNNLKVAVVCFIFDENGKLILQKRGTGARDEVGKLCAIGGSANFSDPSFRDSLMRELREEGGDSAKVRIDEFIGAVPKSGFDKNAGIFNNWIILGYKGTLLSGELINTEPDRCDGFVAKYLEEFDINELAITPKVFVKHMLNNR